MGNKNTIAIQLVVNDNGSVTLKQFGDTVKKAFGETKTSTDVAAKGMRDADSATRTLSEGMGGMEAAVKKVVAAVGTYKIAEFAKDTALQAARYETLGVVMGTVGRNAGYSQERMDGFSLALQKNGISMLESRQGITRMAQAQLNLSQSTDLARVAQDAAVIGQINSSEAFNRMIVGIQTGQVEILRTIGINVNFEESYRRVAKETGRAVESFSEAEKAQIRMNAVLDSGKSIAGTYEAAMTTAGKKITSFTRYVEDFKVKMGEAFGPATVTLVDAATETMKKMQDEIQKPEAQKALKDLSTEIANLAVGLGTNLPGAISKTTTALNGLLSVYNAIPGELVGAAGVGLVGKFLFGSVPVGRALAAAYLTAELITKISGEISKANAGLADRPMSLADSPMMVGNRPYGGVGYELSIRQARDAKEKAAAVASDTLKNLTIPSRGPTIANLATVQADKALYRAAHANDPKPVDEKAIKEAQENHLKGLELIAKLQDDTNRRTDEGMKWFADAEEKKATDLEKEMDSWRKAGDVAVNAMESEIAMGVKLSMNTIERGEKRLQSERDMYADMRGFEQNYFTTTLLMIESQAQKYKDLVINEGAIAKWVEGEKTKALTAYVDKSGTLYQRLTERTRKYKEDAGDIHEGLFKTLDAGFKNLEGQISDNFFSALTGKMDGVRLDWDSMWASMARSASNYAAQIATTAAIDYGGKYVGKAVSTGVDWLVDLFLGYGEGAWEVKKDKITTVHAGEMIIPADVAAGIRDGSGPSLGEGWGFSAPSDFAAPSNTPNMDALGRDTIGGYAGRGTISGAVQGVPGGLPGIAVGALMGFAKGFFSGIAVHGLNMAELTELGRIAAYMDNNQPSPAMVAEYAQFARDIAALAQDAADADRGGGYGFATQDAADADRGGGGSQVSGFGAGLSAQDAADADRGGTDDDGWRYGGIPTGPQSGYWAKLHGTEAIVPLPNGRSIPVEVKASDDYRRGSDEPRIIHTHVYLDRREIALAIGDETETNDVFVNQLRKAVN